MGKTPLYGSIHADDHSTQATRGARRTITSHTRGWDLGVEVRGHIDPTSGEPEFEIRMTGGSNKPTPTRMIALVAFDGEGTPTITHAPAFED